MLLSVVIPTYNRKSYLQMTLEHLLPQVERNLDSVELIVCSNASSDDTGEYIKDLQQRYDFVQYHYFDNFVPICDSFSRSIQTASGKFVILWGDDDIASPYVIDFILEQIKSHDDVGLIHYNVAIGKDKVYDIELNRFENSAYIGLVKKQNLSDFLVQHTVGCGFITSMVFLRQAWFDGLKYHNPQHYGYEFLPIIFAGLKGKICIYCSYPMAIQRMPYQRAWLNKWPLYALIGMPNLLRDIEANGLTTGAYDYWYTHYNGFKSFVKVLLLASAYKKEYRGKCHEMAQNERSMFRKALIYLIVNCCPAFINNSLRKLAHK